MTDVPRTADEFGVLLRGLLAGADDRRSAIVHGVAIGSVVPPVTAAARRGVRRWLPGEARRDRRCARRRCRSRSHVDEPLTVGADRIINTLAASRLYERDAIVVDLGTATTFDCITADGGLPRRRDRAGRAHVGRDAVPAHVEAAGDGARRAGAARSARGRRTASAPA